jgi:hypothetical protein
MEEQDSRVGAQMEEQDVGVDDQMEEQDDGVDATSTHALINSESDKKNGRRCWSIFIFKLL